MDILLFFAIFSCLVLPVVLLYSKSIIREHDDVTGETVNYDSFMRKFVYKVSLTQDEIIHTLTISNDADALHCSFDTDVPIITFSEYGSGVAYYFSLREYDGFYILRLEQVPKFGTQGAIPHKLNPFIVKKLHAQIVSFSQYGF